MSNVRITSTVGVLALLASAALLGCSGSASSFKAELKPDTELGKGTGSRVITLQEPIGVDVNDYKFRMKGSDVGPTTIYLVVGQGPHEREYPLDTCTSLDTDEFLPEGLLTPILCDGRRIVLHQEGASYAVHGARNDVTVPISAFQAGAAPEEDNALTGVFPPL